jgi:N-acetyl-anhydromuramyl-L-alanine amidase AmpD
MANPYPDGGANDVQRQIINLAVLHHTVTAENATWKQLSDIGKTRTYAGHTHSYHYDPETKEETFIAYHFLVYKDGTYRRCLNDAAVGWHCGNWEKNTRSIGITCVGDYSNQNPTEAQLQTIANIIRVVA